jgi:hypothetical protein
VAHSGSYSGQIRDTGGANAFRSCRDPYFSDPAKREEPIQPVVSNVLGWFDPAAQTITPLLGSSVTGGRVDSARLYGIPRVNF